MRQNASMQQAGRGRGNRIGVALGALAVLAAFVLAACGSSDSGDATTTTEAPASKTTSTTEKATTTTDPKATTTTTPGVDELDGAFISTEVTGYDLVPDSELTFTFDGDQLSVNAGCNTLGSAFTLEDDVLTWTGVPRATMMACDDALMAQDTWITDLLTGGAKAEASDGGATLTLTSGDVTITLEGVAASPITGTTWTLDGTIANEAASSLPAGVEAPTLTIAESGTAQIFTGCNTGSTTVEVGDDTLTFAPMAMTRMACPDGGSEVEAAVTAVLDGETSYTVDGDTLTITNGTNGLTYKAS